MNFFGKRPRPDAGSNGLGLLGPPATGIHKQPNSGSLLAVDETKVIDSFSDLPKWTDVLSGPEETGGFAVPIALQDKVLAIRLSATDVVLAYDPSETQQVLNYLASMTNEVAQRGLSLRPKNLLATTQVLSKLREQAKDRSGSRTASAQSGTDELTQFKDLVLTAQSLGATDIHFNPLDGGRGQVLARIDGELEALPQSLKGLSNRDVVRMMRAAYESLAERHSNSSGSFSETSALACMIESKLGIPNLRLRFATQKGLYGPKATLRLLPTEIDTQAMSFEQMGFAPSHIAMLETAQRRTQGIVLQCGITGSGKTTAAKNFLETHFLNGKGAFYQLADPIEYLLKAVHQIYIQRDLITQYEADKKSPYAAAIEAILRMDPDLIDMGEIRDTVSARAAITIAKTGHMSMGTLHVDSVEGIANRLCDPALGLSRNEITSSRILALLCYQALLPKLCPVCCLDSQGLVQQLTEMARSSSASQKELVYVQRLLSTLDKRFGVDLACLRFKNHAHENCPHCHGRGTKGLTIVAEMLTPDKDWLDLTAQGKDRAAWYAHRKTYSNFTNGHHDFANADMSGKTVVEHALYKALMGQIDARQCETFGPLELYEILE